MFLIDSYRKHHAFELIRQHKAEELCHMKLNHIINQLNDRGHSLLYEAIKHFRGETDLSIIHKLLECPDLDINLGCDNSFATKTPLFLACQHGHDEIVKLLLNHSPHSNIQINKFSTCIERNDTTKKGGLENSFKKLKRDLKIHHEKKHSGKMERHDDLIFPSAKTALYTAVENGHFSTADLLIGRNDIDINKGYAGYLLFDSSEISQIHGRSILFLALKRGSKQFIKTILKKSNVDTNFGIQEVSDTNLFEKFPPILNERLDKIECKTPLSVAIDDNQSLDIIELLLENLKTNPNECHAFLQVCKSGNLELMKLFMKSPNLDINFECPLAHCLENMEIVSLFLSQPSLTSPRTTSSNKLDLNAHDGLILKNAIQLKDANQRIQLITQLLQRKDLDVNKGLVFYELCAMGNVELVKLFVSMRKDLKPDLIGPQIKYKHTGSEGFLDVEAHKQAINFQFRPIEIAYMNGHEELAEYLIENTRVKPLDITKLLFRDEREESNDPSSLSFYKVNANGIRELSSGVYALWNCEDDEDKSSVYSYNSIN